MCGITGIYSFHKLHDSELGQLVRATNALNRRGPDMGDTWHDEKVGLGHRRLSILDTSEKAKQPFSDESGNYQLVFNGEIYNFQELKHQLKNKGYVFRTTSDTEVVLYALIEWGASALNRFNGFFAISFYDKNNDYLLIARDRFGIKPLVYFQDESKLIFSSELKALTCFCQQLPIEKRSLQLYFELTYIPPPFTIYENVYKLKPGHKIEVCEGHVEMQAYYHAAFTPVEMYSDYQQARSSLRDKLTQSVQDRLVADVPLGTFLSGGIDSSIISAIAAKSVNELHTFSIGYRDHPFFDETHFAEQVAKRIGSHHHVFHLTNDDLLANVHDAVSYFDEPFADSSALPMFILSQMTRQHVTVALSGDGADEIFSGYNKHEAWMRARQKNAINLLIRNFGSLLKLLPKSRQSKWGNLFRQLQKYREILVLPMAERYWRLASFIPEKEARSLIHVDYQGDIRGFKDELLAFVDSDNLNRVLGLDVQLVLAGDMLTKVDWMSMANSLEVRVPFLDHRVVEDAFRMPQHFKVKGKDRKYILKDAFRDELPDSLFNRGKHGFEVPLLDWFKNELSSELDELVFNKEKIESRGIFNWQEIENIRRQLHSTNPGDVHVKVWQLFVFEKWAGGALGR